MSGARQKMIDAAERLAVERGLGAMTLREVQAAAEQRNKSAAQYHFGSRDGLVDAVVATRMGPINDRRLELLASLPERPTVRPVVEALVLPLADATLRTPGSRWARFLLQGWADPAVQDVVRRSFEAVSYRTVRRQLLAAVQHLPESVRHRRVDQAVGFVVMSLAAAEGALGGDGRIRVPVDDLVTDLVDACVGLLTAPSSIHEPTAPEGAC